MDGKKADASQSRNKWFLSLWCLSFSMLGSAQERKQLIGLKLTFSFSYAASLSQTMKLSFFPLKMGFVPPTRQSCVCLGIDSNCVVAEPQTKQNFLGLWSLNNSWITRALSQKTPCLFLQTWAIKWLCLWNQLPNLCFTGMCLSLDSREFPTWGESRFPVIDPSITWKTITTVLHIPCVISVGTDSTMLRKTNWTREGDVVLTCNSAKQEDYCKLRWVESFPEMLSNGQEACYDLR